MKLEELEEPRARQRQGTRNDLPQHSGKLPECSTGQTRDIIGDAIGLSGRSYEKAKEVIEAAEAIAGEVLSLDLRGSAR
jgi:ParB family chromosome partitioning protein